MIETPAALMETLLMQAIEEPSETAVRKKRGRPARLSNQLLAAGILWCVLHGWVSQWDLWRRISNISDPFQLSGAEIVALSARRWDIELGFRLLIHRFDLFAHP